MSAKAMTIQYADNAVYGNTAYDLKRVRGYAAAEDAPYYDIPYDLPGTKEREKIKERPQTKTRTKTKSASVGVSIFAVAGFAVCAVLIVMMLLSYVTLAEVSATTTELQNTIYELQTEQAALKVEYECAFNLAEVEAYATTTLGMTKLKPENITIVDLERGDKAEILSGDATSSASHGTGEFLSEMVEYFN